MKKNVSRAVMLLVAFLLLFAGCGSGQKQEEFHNADVGNNGLPQYVKSMDLEYANQFTVDYYQDGYAVIRIEDGSTYVLIPDKKDEVDLGLGQVIYIHQPCESTYLAATAAMDFYDQLNCLDYITACSTKAEDYSIENAKERIQSGQISYVGKYSAPDYEQLLNFGVNLAIESTMIYHSPKVRESLLSYGIPVLVERSSYEEDPLGRLEWIKLYGLLYGKEDEAQTFFEDQKKMVTEIEKSMSVGAESPSVVFFYVSSNGYVNVRKPGDYISKMISIAGGSYALESIAVQEENALSTMNVSWEDFYAYSKDADILIYNGTIDGGIKSTRDLLEKNDIFGEFTAIKNKRVYCTSNNMFQEISKTGDMIVELKKIIEKDDSDLRYIKPLDD